MCRQIIERAVDELGDARATRPDSLSGGTVKVGDADTRALQEEWERREIPVPLTVVGSPYRECPARGPRGEARGSSGPEQD